MGLLGLCSIIKILAICSSASCNFLNRILESILAMVHLAHLVLNFMPTTKPDQNCIISTFNSV